MIRAQDLETESMSGFFKAFEKDSAFVKVDPEYAHNTYVELAREGRAHVFLACDDDTGEVVGGLGCIIGPDLHSGEKIAVETFWYVAPEYRSTLHGIQLLDAFEKWAKDNGCAKTAMIHMADSMPDRLERLYLKRGYRLLEKHYIKGV